MDLATGHQHIFTYYQQYDPKQPSKMDYKLSNLDLIAHIGKIFLYLNINAVPNSIHAISVQT
jgi:hypothetical protein